MPKKVAKKGKVVSATGGAKSSSSNSLFKKSPRNFRIGGDIQPKRNLTRFVKWPKYIRIQRQKKILLMRLKQPPALNQFAHTIDKNQAQTLLKILAKYSPETTKEKRDRLKAEAEAKKKNPKAEHVGPKPVHLKYGLNHVTTLVEEGKAKLVVIANDVDPLEIMVHLPALCIKKEIPFCIVKGKTRLGKLCHTKNATCVALTEFKNEDMKDITTLQNNFKAEYNDNTKLRKDWGEGVMGIKNQHMMAKRAKIAEMELAKKANM